MEETDAAIDWLNETDAAIDWLCHELRDWLTEFLHRPETLVTLTLALGGSPSPPNEDAPFKHFAEALTTLLKNGYRDPQFILPVVRYLQQRRSDSIRAGLWTTGSLPRPTYNFEPSSRPPSPVGDLSLDEDLTVLQRSHDAVHAAEYEEDRSREATPWTPPRTPVWVKEKRQEEGRFQEQKKLQEEQKILREQEKFREQKKSRKQERCRQLTTLEERLQGLQELQETPLLPSDKPPLAVITQHALEKHLPRRWSKRLRASRLDHSPEMNGLRPAYPSKVTKTNVPGHVNRPRRQRIIEPLGRLTSQSTRSMNFHLRQSTRIKAQCLDKILRPVDEGLYLKAT